MLDWKHAKKIHNTERAVFELMFDKQCLVVLEQKHEADTQNMESLELLENKLDRMARQLCIELNDAEQYSRNMCVRIHQEKR